MLNVTTAFNEAFKSDLREVKMRIKINDVTYTDEDIVSFNYNAGSIVGESFAIGSTFANTVRLTLCRIVEGLKQLDEVIPEMGIVLPNGSTEFVKLGTFIISEQVNPDRNENRTSIECTDKMIMLDDPYESKLSYPAKIRDVALEIANLAGVEVDKVSFGRLMENTIKKPEGYTFRQALGLIAQFEAGYVCFDRDGLLAIKTLEDENYEVTPAEYFQKGLVKNELLFRPAGIQVKMNSESEDEKVLKIGNEKGSVIRLENKVMTEQLLRLVYEKVKDINYYPYSLNWRGNPAVEVGDWLRVTDLKGNQFKIPNLSFSLEYKGGLTATSTVETVASNEVRYGYKTILEQTIEYVENAIKDVDGNVIYYGVEAPPNPKEGDTWFKYVDSDTEIWVYEKVGEPDVFDWVFKISSAVDDSIKEKIDELEQQSKDQQINIDKALSDAEKAREEAEVARQEAFDSSTIAKQAEKDALDALLKGDQNSTQITTLEGQQKLTNTKVEGNTANILNLQTDSEKLSLSIGKVQSDVDGINGAQLNLITDYPNNEVQLVDINRHYWDYPFTGRNSKIKVKPDTQYIIQWDYDYISGDSPNQMFTAIGYSNENKDYSVDVSGVRGSVVTSQKFIVITTENEDYHKKYPYLAIRFSRTDTPRPSKMNYHSITVREGNLKGPWSPPINAFTSKKEFSTFEQTSKGFQQTVTNDISGLKSQQTQMDSQISSTIEKVDSINTDVANFLNGTSMTETKRLRNWEFEIIRPLVPGDYTFEFKARASKVGLISVYLNDDTGQQRITTQYRNEFNGSLTGNSPSFNIDNGAFKTYFVRMRIVKAPNATNQIKMRVYGNVADIDIVGKEAYLHKGWNYGATWQPAPEDNASKSEVIQLSDQITQTVNKVETVDGKVTSQQSQITQLSNNINLKVDKDNAIAQINLSPESIRLDAKFIHLSGTSKIDDAIIKSAMIDTVSANKLSAGTIDANIIRVINVEAENIVGNEIRGISLTSIDNQGYFNVRGNKAVLQNTSNNRRIEMSDTGIYVYNQNGTLRGELSQSIVNTGLVGTNTYNVYVGTGGSDGVDGESEGGELRVVRYDSTPGDGSVASYRYRPVRAEGFVGNYVNVNTPLNGPSHLYLRPRYGVGEVRVTASGTIDYYHDLRARSFFGNTLDINSSLTGDHIYIRPSANGEVRFTMTNTTDVLRDFRGAVGFVHSLSQSVTGTNFYIGTDGEVRITSRGLATGDTIYYRDIRASNFITNSQEESKQNIRESTTSALDVIESATIYNYRLKSELSENIDREHTGLVIGSGYKTPQEVVQNGGINQYAMNSLAWKAIQELNQKIFMLEEKLKYANIA